MSNPHRPRRLRLALALTALAALAPALWAYGYRREEDPLLAGFKNALVHARKGEWAAAQAEVEKIRWQVDELKDDVGVDFSEPLDRSIRSRDAQQFAGAMANLVYLALLQKFHWNDQERLSDHDKAKARLYSAEVYYLDVLDGNVQRADRRDGTRRSERIKERFRDAKRALGSPGLFGAGARPADPDASRRATDEIAELLAEAFPSFVRPE